MCWQRQDRFDTSEAMAVRPAPGPDVRVSDSDRHAVIDDLQRHTADGRLTLDEFEERVDDVLRARTGAELAATTRDLPATTGPAPARPRASGLPIKTVVVVSAVIALVAAGLWWVLIPAFFLFGGCGHHGAGRRHRSEHREEAVTYV